MGAASAPAQIYGNIELASNADTINVTNGETLFDGIVNSGCMPAGGPTALTLDNPAQNACGVGTLNINSGGNFHLTIDPVDGPSYVFMNTLNMGTDGTITFDLPPAVGGTIPIGTYPQVFVETANLNGTLVANIAPNANGLWDTTTYQNVIDAVVRNGTFNQCIINGIPTGSLLISAGCVYDDQANVDITVNRAPFESVQASMPTAMRLGRVSTASTTSTSRAMRRTCSTTCSCSTTRRTTTPHSTCCRVRFTPTTCSRSRALEFTRTISSTMRPIAKFRRLPVRFSSAAQTRQSMSGVSSTIRHVGRAATSMRVRRVRTGSLDFSALTSMPEGQRSWASMRVG